MKSTSKKRSRSKKVQKRTGIGKGAIAGIVVAVLLFLALIGTLMLILHDNAKDFVRNMRRHIIARVFTKRKRLLPSCV